jgi:hypothetical protein
MGFTRSKSDVCMYYQGDKEHKTIILLYVDDIIIASKQTADVMTKPLMKADHWRHTDNLLK